MAEFQENDSNAKKSSFDVKFKDRGKRDSKRFYTEEYYRNQLKALKSAGVPLNKEIRENLKKTSREFGEITGKKEETSNTDFLTGLPNKRYFKEAGKDRMAESKRYKIPLFFGYIDVDNFKSFNDECGHQAGDEFLQILGQLFKANLKREEDIFARLGGDEFGFIIFDSDLAKVKNLVEDIKKDLQTLVEENFQGLNQPLGFSVGFEKWDEMKDIEEIMNIADQKLYREKEEKHG